MDLEHWVHPWDEHSLYNIVNTPIFFHTIHSSLTHLLRTNVSHVPIKMKDYLSLAHQFPDNVPITVIQMFRFNSTAIYPSSLPFAPLEPISGRDAFSQHHVPAANAAAQRVSITPAETSFFSIPVTNLLLHNHIP